MIVYLVVRDIPFPYDGSDVLGVFATFDLADDFLKSRDSDEQRYLNIDEWQVVE